MKKHYKKIALVLSLCLLIAWGLLGTGASLAWFSDTSPELKNIFHIADFDLEVYHRLDDGETYELIDGQTDVFDDQVLYEPGYVQVVYLKVVNNGDVPFDYQMAVLVHDYTTATNVFGQDFLLHEYLKFGIVTADTEAELESKVSDREKAKEIAQEEATTLLNNYHTAKYSLDAGDDDYIALIVRMPEEVGNVANYRGDTVPMIELSLSVSAEQKH